MEDLKTLATQGIEPNGGGALSSNVSKLGSKEVSKKLRNFPLALLGRADLRTDGVKSFFLAPWGEGVRRTGEGSRVEIAQPLLEDPFCTKSIDFGKRRHVRDDKLCHAELVSASHLRLCNDKFSSKASDTVFSRFTSHFSRKMNPSQPSLRKGRSKCAFTLAEVLITLGIIGVVAALTIPQVVQNYQKQATATALKKAYSELNQVLQRSMVDNGDIKTWNNSFDFGVDNWAKTYIEPYVKVEKSGSCAQNTSTRCLGMAYVGVLGGNPNDTRRNIAPYMIVKSGGSLAWAFFRYPPYEEFRVLVYLKNPAKSTQSAIRGKDVFTFVLKPSWGVFKPFGLEGTVPYQGGTITRDMLLNGPIRTGGCYKSSGGPDYYGPGDSCGAVIMMDGWKISKDYPW